MFVRSISTVTDADARALLDPLVDRYERPAFIDDDPVSVPRAFDDPADQEVIGLYAAILAWGRRSVILSKLAELVDRMDARPHQFVRDFRPGSAALDGFKHRTFSSADAAALTLSVRAVLERFGSLGELFASGLDPDDDVGPAIQTFSDTLLGIVPEAGMRTKHLARPSTGSACKRLAMYARWMTRPGPVDLGVWADRVRTDQLVIPLDVHTGTQARQLGLLERRYDDWRAVQELTDVARRLSPEDPARYDFALFGLGAYGGEESPTFE